MNVIECAIPGPLIIEPRVFGDERGFFLESWNASAPSPEHGLEMDFSYRTITAARRLGVLRGLHYQTPGAAG